MVKIGVFARLAQVSIKTLHFYDEVGLLRPAQVDAVSGYRFYALEQLPRLNRILALKDLGLSLEQIAALLQREPPPREMRALLERKREELCQRLRDDEARLARVEARLNEIDREGQMSDYDVVVKQVEPQLVASIRSVIPNWGEVSPILGNAYRELIEYVKGQDGKLAGPAFDVWYDAVKHTDIHVESALPLLKPIAETERVKVYEMPGVAQAASLMYRGSFDGLPSAFASLLRWVEANHYLVCGPAREVYLQYDPHGDPSQWLTEVIYAVESRSNGQTAN